MAAVRHLYRMGSFLKFEVCDEFFLHVLGDAFVPEADFFLWFELSCDEGLPIIHPLLP